MKTRFAITLVLLLSITNLSAQRRSSYSESYGHTLNLGLGIGGYSGYYGEVGHTMPVLHANYEFEVARNFTLAPFVTLFSYDDGNYRETVVPLGVKGTLYLDKLLEAGRNWDFYTAGSLGFALVNTSWDVNYYGDRAYYREASPLFLDLHIGTEYHFNKHIGAFLDLSTGVSTIGIAIH